MPDWPAEIWWITIIWWAMAFLTPYLAWGLFRLLG